MYERKDKFYRKAKAEGFRSRAAYKLIELNKTHRLFKKGDRVFDIGCAPGGFLQVVSEAVGPGGVVAGIDLLDVPAIGRANVAVIKGDARDPERQTALLDLLGGPADCILSDMAPNTTGVGFADAFKSFELASMVLDLCSTHLRPKGNLLVKVFLGDEFERLRERAEAAFSKVTVTRPEATRKASCEVYLTGTRRRA
ncbi:MAG: RlmE family RNA methyltransferase [Deltaproteobacteria bacterium]|nr:RlmE family RNA methyltransferase [Deltaproteobacteria bacterium]